MTTATHALLTDFLRLVKSAVAVSERWLKEQPIEKLCDTQRTHVASGSPASPASACPTSIGASCQS